MNYLLIAYLTIVNLLNYFDRYIVNAIEPLLKKEFELSNSDSALLAAAFVIGYSVFSPFFGYLGDRVRRPILMGIGVIVWSLATALTGLAGSFATFFLARVLVGIGEASFAAIIPGFLKDRINNPISLNTALSIFYVAIPVGAALGYAFGGWYSSKSSWQSVFFIAAIPGIFLAPGLFLLREKRQQIAAVIPDIKSGLKQIWNVKIIRFAILGYILNTFALGGIAPFVVRYGMSLGFEQAEISKYFGLILLFAGIIGTFGGGALATYLAKKSSNSNSLFLNFVGIASLIGVPILVLAFIVSAKTAFLICCFFAELILFAGVAPINAVIVSNAPENLKTLTQGFTILLIQILGSVLGPYAVGLLADFIEKILTVEILGQGRLVIDNVTLGWSLQITSIAMAFSGLIWILGARYARSN